MAIERGRRSSQSGLRSEKPSSAITGERNRMLPQLWAWQETVHSTTAPLLPSLRAHHRIKRTGNFLWSFYQPSISLCAVILHILLLTQFCKSLHQLLKFGSRCGFAQRQDKRVERLLIFGIDAYGSARCFDRRLPLLGIKILRGEQIPCLDKARVQFSGFRGHRN